MSSLQVWHLLTCRSKRSMLKVFETQKGTNVAKHLKCLKSCKTFDSRAPQATSDSSGSHASRDRGKKEPDGDRSGNCLWHREKTASADAGARDRPDLDQSQW